MEVLMKQFILLAMATTLFALSASADTYKTSTTENSRNGMMNGTSTEKTQQRMEDDGSRTKIKEKMMTTPNSSKRSKMMTKKMNTDYKHADDDMAE
jgi:hypothetical protein